MSKYKNKYGDSLYFVPLSTRVLVVAVVNESVGDWAAYVDAVPGHNHVEELIPVAEDGNKVRLWMAERLFPDLANEYKWRQ